MKVALISVSDKGGAGAAAYRLHCSLLSQTDIVSYFVQEVENTSKNATNIVVVEPNSSILYRLRRRMGLTTEIRNAKLLPKHSPTYEYEIATFPNSPYDIENHPIVQEADIIHLHWVANFLDYPSFFKKIKKPIVWTLHDMNAFSGIFHYEGDKEANADKFGELDKSIEINKIKYIHKNKNITLVAPSQWLMNKSKASKALGQYPHHVIPYGISIDLHPLINKETAKRKIGIDNEYPTLLLAAHSLYVKRKGADLFYSILNKLEGYNFNIVTLGDGDEKIERKNVNHIHVPYTYDRDLINNLYAAADITLLPSREDNLPNIILESLINGTPLISFANGGMAEHISVSKKTGILLDSISSEALCVAITDFFDGKYSFDRNTVRQYAIDTFAEQLEANSYKELYQKLLTK